MKPLIGIVTSTKMNKAATVEVSRIWVHPVYKKRIRIKKKYHAHDEMGVKKGNKVRIVLVKPISKTKKWQITEIIKKQVTKK